MFRFLTCVKRLHENGADEEARRVLAKSSGPLRCRLLNLDAAWSHVLVSEVVVRVVLASGAPMDRRVIFNVDTLPSCSHSVRRRYVAYERTDDVFRMRTFSPSDDAGGVGDVVVEEGAP